MDKELYDGLTEEVWKVELDAQSEWNIRHLLSLFSMFGVPESMLDVGCGNGDMVRTATKLGVEAYGVDQLVDEITWPYNFSHANLVDVFKLPKQVSLVTCFEVAEHLHQTAHPTLCTTLAENLKSGSGNFLIFSSAFPNQGGIGHLAERPSKYWMDELSLRGFNYRKDLTVNLSLIWSNISSPLYWLPANVLVFEK